MTQDEFAAKWKDKIVRPKRIRYDWIPGEDYVVTAALYEWDGDITIFAIMSLDYTIENKRWYTFHLPEEELDVSLADFEILEGDEAP